MPSFSKLAASAVLLCATSAQAVELPDWSTVRICATVNAGGPCRIFEAKAKRTILCNGTVLPEDYRSACLEEIKEPYIGYTTLSQCLEGQALRGLRMIGTAAIATLEDKAHAAPAASAEDKIETVGNYFKGRENWASEKKSKLATKVRLAALPSTSLVGGLAKVSDAMPSIIVVAESEASSGPTEVPPAELEKSLKALLAERESWGTEPSSRTASASGEEAGTSSASAESEPTTLTEYLARRDSWGTGPSTTAEAASAEASDAPSTEAEPTTLSEYIARREAWGSGAPAKPVEAPLAEGAVSPLPKTATATAAAAADANESPVIVHPAEPSPVPQISEVPRTEIDKALSELLAERESWGTAPAAKGQQMAARSADAASCEAELREAASKGTILFRSGSAVLDAASYPILDELSARAKSCQNVSIYIEGHTDDLGSERMNRKLSEARAKAVLSYLAKSGVDTSRMKAVGFGKSRPLVPNTTDENRAKNRRIEFSVR